MQDAASISAPSIPPTNPSTSNPALGISTGTMPTVPAQIDPAKLEAIRKATLNSYKNKFLNLRDKFDKVNAVRRSLGSPGCRYDALICIWSDVLIP
jgi:hypothetical protein